MQLDKWLWYALRFYKTRTLAAGIWCRGRIP